MAKIKEFTKHLTLSDLKKLENTGEVDIAISDGSNGENWTHLIHLQLIRSNKFAMTL